MDVGATLRSARERSGLTLEELARRTKISVRVLRALESDAFDAVPRGIFARGFLRAYAREVGLDPAATVEQFLARLEPVESASRNPPAEDPADDVVVSGYRPYEMPSDSGSEAGKAIAIALVSLGFVAYLSMGTPEEPVEAPVFDAAVPAILPSGRPEAAVVLAFDAAQPVATAGDILDIEIRSTGPCWVEATADGSRRVYRLMQAGDLETLTVHDTLVLRVGNPAAFAFSVNGRPGHLPGRPGQPITIRIDGENFTRFLSAT